MRIYFANDLFNEATRLYNEKIVGQIRETFPQVSIYLPQENDAINDKSSYADSVDIAVADYTELKNSDILVAVLDNQDFGVGVEIGLAYEMQIPIIGIYTDVRQQGSDNDKKIAALKAVGENQFFYINLMANGLIKKNGTMVTNTEELLYELQKYLDLD